MEVTREELLHIVQLADLKIKEEEIDNFIGKYRILGNGEKAILTTLRDILDFADVVCKAPVDNLKATIASNTNCNLFRKDEVIEFENEEALMQNAPEAERNMFKIPKVL